MLVNSGIQKLLIDDYSHQNDFHHETNNLSLKTCPNGCPVSTSAHILVG